jgi:hypothetical protein
MRLADIKVLTCQHVACPWLFPRYFAEKWDWLQYVSEEFVQHSLQFLDVSNETRVNGVMQPTILCELPLHPQVWIHSERDVAMLAIDEENEARWDELMCQYNLHAMALEPAKCTQGETLIFMGHQQCVSQDSTQETSFKVSDTTTVNEETVGQYPKVIQGHFAGQSQQNQSFAWSQEILEEGMCGGAVVNKSGRCVGMIEGIVPPFDPAAYSIQVISSDATPEEQEKAAAIARTAQMQKTLENHVAFIPSIELEVFLHTNQEFLLTGMALEGR